MTHEKLEEAGRLHADITVLEWYLKCLQHHDLRVDFTAIGMDVSERPFPMQNVCSFLGTEDERRFVTDADRYELDRSMVKAMQDVGVNVLRAHLAKLKQEFADV